MKKYKLAVIALLALVSLSVASCLFSYLRGSLQDLSRQAYRKNQDTFKLQKAEFRKLNTEHTDWKNLPQDLREFRHRRISSMDDFAIFRRDLNSCLDENGFKAPTISLQFGSGPGQLRKVSIDFSLSGEYPNLKKFIFAMERKPKMNFFTSMDLNSNGETVSGRFTMEAYLEK
jgi:Tfp pilus assembly protein PilO